MEVLPLNFFNPITKQGSVKKRKSHDSVYEFMVEYRKRNAAREPSPERYVSQVQNSNNVAYAKELCQGRTVSEIKEVHVVYADNHGERRVQEFDFLTGFPKKKRSVPADDDTTTTSMVNQLGMNEDKPEVNVTTISTFYKEDEKQDHQQQHKQERKYQRKERRSKDVQIREKGKKKKKKALPEPASPQEAPQTIRNTISELGGTTPIWLNEKVLSKSDTLRQQARLFLPVSLALHEFLTPAEREKCFVLKNSSNESNQKKKNGLIVTVVDPEGETSEMKFKKWGSLDQYVLSGTNWNDLVRKFNMERPHTKLQFWCFRKTDSNKLCFAIDMLTEDRG